MSNNGRSAKDLDKEIEAVKKNIQSNKEFIQTSNRIIFYITISILVLAMMIFLAHIFLPLL